LPTGSLTGNVKPNWCQPTRAAVESSVLVRFARISVVRLVRVSQFMAAFLAGYGIGREDVVTGLETPLIRLVTCRRAERAIAAGSHLCP
jgi:hypothetical protein